VFGPPPSSSFSSGEPISSLCSSSSSVDIASLTSSNDYTGVDEHSPPYSYMVNVCALSNSSPECRRLGGGICQHRGGTGAYTALIGSWINNPLPVWSYIQPKDPSSGISVRFNNGGPQCYLQGVPYPRQAIINFPCTPGARGSITSIVEDDHGQCLFTITFPTEASCPNSANHNSGLSAGWAFLIMLMILIPLYVLGGCAFKHYRLGASGMEACPNVEFWRDLPSLVMDGVRFTMNKARSEQGAKKNQVSDDL